MTKDDKLKFCRYYKGEEECPFKTSYGDSDEHPTNREKAAYWYWEREYFTFPRLQTKNRAFFETKERWEQTAHDFPQYAAYMNSNLLPKKTKGLISYALWLLSGWSPMSIDDFLYYPTEEEKNIITTWWQREQWIRQCKVYRGEMENPYYGKDRPENLYWTMEDIYVNHVMVNEAFQQNYGNTFLFDFPDCCEDVKIPFYLKATIYELYYKMCGSGTGFREYLRQYANFKRKKDKILFKQ